MRHDQARSVLGVQTGATIAEVQQTFRRLAQKCHPDRAKGSATRMAEITEARRTLLEPVPPSASIAHRPPREPSTYSEALNLHRGRL
jgi:curved DNA-binding protein CbpA